MKPGVTVICGLPGPWLAELQSRHAKRLGSGDVEPVVPRPTDKHYGLLQDALARLKQRKRNIDRLLVCRGFGMSAYSFEMVKRGIDGRASVVEYEDISRVLEESFPRSPGKPVDHVRLISSIGERLLIVHEPLIIGAIDGVLSQFGIETTKLRTKSIEVNQSLSKAQLQEWVASYAPSSCAVSTHREKNWRPSDVLLRQGTPLPQTCRIWKGRTVFQALHEMMFEYETGSTAE